MNATALKAERQARLDEFVALALVKLGVDYTGDTDSLKVLKKKSDEQMIANLSRLRTMRDFDTVTPAAPEVVAAIPAAPEATGGNGNGARRKATPKVSEGKLNFAASLLREVWGDDEAAELIDGLGQFDRDHIDRMIDNLKTLIPSTPDQLRFAMELYDRKFRPGLRAEFAASVERMTKAEAKKCIDDLLALPDMPREQQAPAARRKGPEVEADGMYRDPATGDVFKVQVAVHGSGKLYAKKLVKLDEPVMKRGKEATHEFVMAPGAIMRIKPEWRMTADDAKEFGKLYGCCCRCGLTLTDEASIDAGLGPDCRKKGM